MHSIEFGFVFQALSLLRRRGILKPVPWINKIWIVFETDVSKFSVETYRINVLKNMLKTNGVKQSYCKTL